MNPNRSTAWTLPAVLLAVLAAVSISRTIACAGPAVADQTAMELGRKVLAVRKEIQAPGSADAMQAVTDLGHDQRYYVMVRGWLSCQLEGDRSILSAAGEETPDEVRERIEFLEKAVRAIDLE